jgi:catechol 2,3-dioxygenase-like lactoylglutathione lyase family enzyme
MRIGITELFVEDQGKARTFYTEELGLEVKSDAAYGDGRWLTVVSPEDPEGPEIKLSPLTGAAAVLQRERREAGVPALSFTTEDCERRSAELKAKGVRFISEPSRRDYGGIDAVFDDGCGNLLNLHQH